MKSNATFRRSAALLAAVAGFAAAPVNVGAADPVASPSATAQAAVDTKNFAYMPSEISVAAGTTVVFKNSDSVAHTVSATDESFDSGDMAPGASWSHLFAKAGTYTYLCTYHRYMQGTVIVK